MTHPMERPETFSLANQADETLDAVLGGRIKVLQRRKGYRFSIDAVLLADFVAPNALGKVAELGTGSGVVSLLLAVLAQPTTIRAFEIQPTLLELARRNILLNGMDKIVGVAEQDIKQIAACVKGRSFDLVVSNPPYHEVATGRVSTDPERAIARHEVACTLKDVVEAMAHLVRPGGKVAMVHRAIRLNSIITTLNGADLEPVRIRFVHPHEGSPAELVLIEGGRRGAGDGSVTIVSPLVIHDERGEYTREARAILWGQQETLSPPTLPE